MTTLEQAHLQAPAISHAHHSGKHGRLRFAGHFVEMQLAMMVGMMVGGPLGISAVAGVELRAALWLIVMVVPMIAWMTVRGMSRQSSVGMSAAMIVPTVAILPVFLGRPDHRDDAHWLRAPFDGSRDARPDGLPPP